MDEEKINQNDASSPTIKKAAKKKAAKKKAAKKSSKTKESDKPVKPTRNYPIITLQNCLIIAQKIKELNGGNAWSPKEVSKAIKIGDSNKFYYFSSASRDFGL